MPELTGEQRAAVECGGKCIVSASAGSGKTFVMIEKICDFVEDGGDLENILAITYTQKAAAQMKEKLRLSLIKRIRACDDEGRRAHIKAQLNKIAYADVSTVHSFCSRLIRTYFYIADVDAGFDIVSSDDSSGQQLMTRAVDDLFEEGYESGDGEFMHLLECYRKKRSDLSLKKLVLSGYAEARNLPDYREKLSATRLLFCEDGFNKVCNEIHAIAANTLNLLIDSINKFEAGFHIQGKTAGRYAEIFAEMRANINAVIDEDDIFEPIPPLYSGSKPRDSVEDKAEGERFSDFKDGVAKRYKSVYGDLEDRQTEFERFMLSGKTAIAYCDMLLKFDDLYTEAKRQEGKLDYGDLEHCALKVLQSGEVLSTLHARYKRVYVDEFQDVNPVQDKIINALCGGDAFFVGDKKQAIYGFRGSRSSFFDKKIDDLRGGDGTALELTSNFRSGDGVINFVNGLFSEAMNASVCGFSYEQTGVMRRGGRYPEGYGNAEIDVFGEEEDSVTPEGVYSVKENSCRNMPQSPLGRAVLEVVKRELEGEIFDLETGAFRPTQPGDICVLTRKRSNEDALGIAAALREAGYSVTGAKEDNICLNPEIRQLTDILSYLDNAEQDIPMCACMLSAAGGFCEDELATVRLAYKGEKNLTFRACAQRYAAENGDSLAEKLNGFYKKCEGYRSFAEMTGAGALIDKLCADGGYEAAYSAGGGEKLKNVRRLQSLAYAGGSDCSLSAFLKKLKNCGYSVSAPESADSDSITIMTMHSSKGLEFPVVIIADICTSFKGATYSEMPFDDDYGFAPRWYDVQNKLCGGTVLRKLCKLRADREEIKNELNLLYVACTRAMCNLHIFARETEEYNPVNALFAKNYAQLANFGKFKTVEINCPRNMPQLSDETVAVGAPDEQLLKELEGQFMRPYAHESSVNLSVKMSPSKIIKLHLDKDGYAVKELFKEDELPADNGAGKTGADRGTAYHKFLQLCDFLKNSRAEVEEQFKNMCESGAITEEQASLLSVDNLFKILSMEVFSRLGGAEIYREKEFLCRLKARDFLDADSDDGVLIQGAIDLLAVGGGGAEIIDYKYSHKTDGELIKTYAPQLALYKKAVSVITGIGEDSIKTTIVNICNLSEISL